MISNFLKKLPNKEQVMQQPMYRPIRRFLHSKCLWRWHHSTVSRACAIGMVGAFTPWPLQMLQCAVLAVIFRAHLPLSVGLVWITNPVTIPFFLIMVYYTGALLLGYPLDSEHIEWTSKWFWDNQSLIIKPILVGCVVHAIIWSAVLRGIVYIFWRRKVRRKWTERRMRRSKTTT